MKKLTALVLAFLLASATLLGCGGQGSSDASKASSTTAENQSQEEKTTEATQKEETTSGSEEAEAPYNVRMIFCIPNEVPDKAAVQRINDAMNKITLRDLNMTVSLEFTTFATYNDQITLALSSGEDYDLFTSIASRCPSWVNSGYLVDMKNLLNEYGQGILSSYSSPDIATAPQVNGFVYGVPVHKEIAMQPTIFFRTDILEKYDIDVSKVASIEDVNAIYEKVAEKEPDMWMVAPEVGGNAKAYSFDSLGTSPVLGVTIGDIANSTTVVPLYETDEFKNWCKWAHTWYQKGWINPGVASDTESYYSYIQSGQAFSFFSDYGHPLSEADQEKNCGNTDLTMVTIGEPFCTTNTSAVFCYSIPSGSKDPVKAMKMLNYLMTSTEMMNLLNWGEEGVDYVVNDEGLLDYPEGVDAKTVGYHLGAGWILPNQFVCTPWASDGKDIYDKVAKYNTTAVVSKLLGFVFDPAPVADQIAACQNIVDTYYKSLQTGAVDPDEYLPQFMDELKASGLQDILDEEQRQIDEFLKK